MRSFFTSLGHFLSCKWEIAAAQPMVAVLNPIHGVICGYSMTEMHSIRPEPVTQVLQVCKVCGKLRTQTLHGNWTMNDLKGGLPCATA